MEEEQENSKDSNVKSTIDAVTGLVKAIPVYEDAVQPAAQQIGKSLETVSRTVNIALSPIKALVWGYEKIEEYITSRVSEKLKNIPKENIVSPPPQVAGPAVEALKYSGHDENLRELYASLLATAMNKQTIHKAHPGFVEIIKNLTSDEAKLVKAFTKNDGQYPLIDIHSGSKKDTSYFVVFSNYSLINEEVELERLDLLPSYLENFCRLGVLIIPTGIHLQPREIYDQLKNNPEVVALSKKIEASSERVTKFELKMIKLTSFGKLFVENVVNE